MKQGNLTWAELSGHQQFWRMVLGWLAGSGIMGDCDLKNVSGCSLSSRRRGLGGEKNPRCGGIQRKVTESVQDKPK